MKRRYFNATRISFGVLMLLDDAGLEHMAARSRGNGTNFDWLRKSCDKSTCDLSPDGNPEKYGRPMKSAIHNSKITALRRTTAEATGVGCLNMFSRII